MIVRGVAVPPQQEVVKQMVKDLAIVFPVVEPLAVVCFPVLGDPKLKAFRKCLEHHGGDKIIGGASLGARGA